MKTKIIFALAFTAFTFVSNSFAFFNPKKIIETTWTGSGIQVYNEEGDYVLIGYELTDIHFDAVSFTFTGKKRSSVEIDGINYYSTVNFKATYQVNVQQIFIEMGTLVCEDQLPYEITWAHHNMQADLFAYDEENCMYFMNGFTIDEFGNPLFEIGFYNGFFLINDNA